MVGSRRSFLVYIAAILCYEPVLAQPLGFIHGFASAIEQSAVQRTVSIPNFRYAVFVLKFRVAFLTGHQVKLFHLCIRPLFFVCQAHNAFILPGPITGPALMAEIGDVRRFKNKKALVAFAGIDAPPFQSGNFESKSRHVSKRGSPHLRRTVFLVANIILTLSHKDNSVFCFMDKKRAEGKHYYVYTIAGSAKFLRIYYARVSEYLRTQEPPAAAICLDCKD